MSRQVLDSEPDTLIEIRAARRSAAHVYSLKPIENSLENQLIGGWKGAWIAERRGGAGATIDRWAEALDFFEREGAELGRAIGSLTVPQEPQETPSSEASACKSQSIDAQLRAHVWGFLMPGRPEDAAALAYRDARAEHTQSGIYAAMFAAAVVSTAFVAVDPLEAIYVGVGEIPDSSRMCQTVYECLNDYKKGIPWEDALKTQRDKFCHLDERDALRHVGPWVLALIYGGGDIQRSMSAAEDFDTALNESAVTVGAVLGVFLGSEGFQLVEGQGSTAPSSRAFEDQEEEAKRLAKRTLEAIRLSQQT